MGREEGRNDRGFQMEMSGGELLWLELQVLTWTDNPASLSTLQMDARIQGECSIQDCLLGGSTETRRRMLLFQGQEYPISGTLGLFLTLVNGHERVKRS